MLGPGNDDRWRSEKNFIHMVDISDKGSETLTSPLRPFVDEKNGYVVLGRSGSAHKKWRRKGLLQIGAVGEHQEMGNDLFGREVLIDAAFPHIIFICGKRGSGKSYTLGIFAEELIRSAIGVGVILVDPIGIFWSLKTENTTRSEKRNLGKWGLSPTSFPEVKVLAPGDDADYLPSNCDGPFTIGVGEMTAEDWCQVFDMERFKTQGLLIGTVIDLIRKGYSALMDDITVDIPGRPGIFSIGDIIQCIETSTTIISKTGGFNPQTRRSLIARFRAAAGWGIFSVEGTPIRELTSPNRVTVLDVSDTKLGDAKRSLITGIIARKVLAGRIRSSRIEEGHDIDENDPNHIPLTWLLIDEAHTILPHGRQTPATDALIEYAKQGRRPGCALILATQRPSSTSDEILSQVDLLIGHNLALEDDMSALRRRVPAKLPQEFAISDFIRGIPVGTAIVADQKTQQRAFLMKLRPRLSHHAGSSAMPKAFQEKKKRKRKVPMTATHIPINQHPVSEPTPIPVIPEEIEEELEDIKPMMEQDIQMGEVDTIPEGPLPNIPWGSTILLKDRRKEDLEMFIGNIEGSSGILLLSNIHPDKYDIPDALGARVDLWLSSISSEVTVPSEALEEINQRIRTNIKNSGPWVIILDGIEFLLTKNQSIAVKDLLKELHEMVFSGKHLLIVRTDKVIDSSILDGLVGDIDTTEPRDLKDMGEVVEKKTPSSILSDSTLTPDELKWMCNVMDLSTEGSESDLLDRLIEVEKESFDDVSDQGSEKSILKHVMEESNRAREENERLRNLIKDLESEVGVEEPIDKTLEVKRSRKRVQSDRKLVLVWEDEEDQEEKVREWIDEVEDLKEELDHEKMEESNTGMEDSLLNKILERLDDERNENLNRLNRLEEILQGEMESIRDEMEEQRKQMDTPRKAVKLRVIKKKPPLKVESAQKVKKKKVLKKGPEITAISSKIGPTSAMEIAKRNLKRSLLRGPKESIDEVTPYFIPLYRFLVSYKKGLMKNIKESDVYIDALTGEIVEQGRSGLRRTKGFTELLKVTDLEMSVLKVLSRNPKDPTWIAKYSKVDMGRAKRCLTSLEKKGLIRRIRREANLDHYSLREDLKLPRRPWTRDHGFEPEYITGIQEKFIEPRVTEKDASLLLRKISIGVKVLEQDIVRYPIYLVRIRGEGRIRYIAIDGIGGRFDRELSVIAKSLLS